MRCRPRRRRHRRLLIRQLDRHRGAAGPGRHQVGGLRGIQKRGVSEAQKEWKWKPVQQGLDDGGNGGHVGQTPYAAADGHDDEEGGWIFPGVAGLKGLVVVARLREHEKEKKERKVRGHTRATPSMEVVRKKVVGAWDRRGMGMEIFFPPPV